MTPRKDKSGNAPYVSRHDEALRAEAEELLGRASSSSVELRLVDPGDGDVHVVMTAVLSETHTRRESCSLDAEHLANWLRCKLGTYCRVPKKGAHP